MIRTLAGTLLLVLPFVAAPALGQEGGPGLPPKMVRASILDDGSLLFSQTVIVPVQELRVRKVPVTEIREMVVAGVTRKVAVVVETEVTETVTRYVFQTETTQIDKAKFYVLDLKGNKVEGRALAKEFEKPRKALLLGQEKPLDSFYADFFKPETLVIYSKAVSPEATANSPVQRLPATDIPGPQPVPRPKPAP